MTNEQRIEETERFIALFEQNLVALAELRLKFEGDLLAGDFVKSLNHAITAGQESLKLAREKLHRYRRWPDAE